MRILVGMLAVALALVIGVTLFMATGGEEKAPPTGCLNTYNEATEQWNALSGDASLESYLTWDDDKGIITGGGFDAWAEDNGYDLNPRNCYFGTGDEEVPLEPVATETAIIVVTPTPSPSPTAVPTPTPKPVVTPEPTAILASTPEPVIDLDVEATQECLATYYAVVEEWNAHVAANDAVYQQYATDYFDEETGAYLGDGGHFEGWAEDMGYDASGNC